jgi:hypothetical protein
MLARLYILSVAVAIRRHHPRAAAPGSLTRRTKTLPRLYLVAVATRRHYRRAAARGSLTRTTTTTKRR